jgi:hypothetical protein
VPYLTANILSPHNPSLFKNKNIQLPLLFLAGVNPWIYGKLPLKRLNLEKICPNNKPKKHLEYCDKTIKMSEMAARNPELKNNSLQQFREDSRSDCKNNQSKFNHSTMDLAEMVS